jgi:hypothetical protein
VGLPKITTLDSVNVLNLISMLQDASGHSCNAFAVVLYKIV